MALIDLNDPGVGQHPEDRDHGRRHGPVEVVFRDHQGKLRGLFEQARKSRQACLAAAAWVTDPTVLGAMATIPTSLVVQKEDLWRPDIPAGSNLQAWRARLRRQYEAIESSGNRSDLGVPFDRLHMPEPLCDMNYGVDGPLAGVRCFGLRNNRDGEGQDRHPLMHNKFFIFVSAITQPAADREGEEFPALDPHWRVEAVWTGSYNPTRLSPRSRENAVIIRDPFIGDAYLREWAGIMALSEPLDWDAEWIDPEWRHGT